jgi:hypothetical protein
VNLSLKLGRTIAGFAVVGLLVAGFIHLPTSNSQSVDRTMGQSPPLENQPIRLNSAQIALEDAKVAVSLSQAQLAQARMNLTEFQAKHDSAKILSAQGKVSRQEADTAKAAYNLAQLQHNAASIGLQESTAQIIAAKAEVSKLGCKPNSVTEI